MGYYANRLKKKLDNMSEEEFEQKMQEMEEDCNIGPEASEFIKEQENYIKLYEKINQSPKYREVHKSHTMDDNCLIIKAMEQKELTAQEIVEKLIDEQKISGKEVVILLNAINKPAEVRIEKEYILYKPPITTPWYQTLDTREPKCYEPGGTCTNPHRDCINCPNQ